MTDNKKNKTQKFKVYVKPQSISDCFIATMDPKDPFKICLYPSIKSQGYPNDKQLGADPDDLEQLILHNYLILKRDCMREQGYMQRKLF